MTSSTAGLGAQRVEIVEIGDARQQRHGDLDPSRDSLAALRRICGRDGQPRPGWMRTPQRHRILGRQQRGLGEKRHDAEAAPAGALADRGDAAVEQPDIAAEFVDDIAGQPAALGRRQQRVRADELRDDAAALDVADQHDRHVGGLGEAHIGDVAGAQIDLGRAAGALDEHEIGLRGEPVEGCQHARQQRSAPASGSRAPPRCPRPGRCSTICAAPSDCGFSSTGFMSLTGGDAAGARLQAPAPGRSRRHRR